MTMSKDLAPFDGAKIAILRRAEVLTLLRDDNPNIVFPNMWDLPGGGREHEETPFETAARETLEELSVPITSDKVIYHKEYAGRSHPQLRVHFFVARWDELTDEVITLGDEGQCWKWMSIESFIAHEKAVPSLRERLEIAKLELGF